MTSQGMTGAMRRGACPSLSAPMATGDGLLVRINPRGGSLRPHQLAGIARASARHGNGILEITARGNLQVRGLAAGTVAAFAADISELEINADEGVEIRTGPLAGCDAKEVADSRPLAEAIRTSLAGRGLAGRLAAKVSVVVDGGGALGLGALAADVRLEAVAGGDGSHWRIGVGGNAEHAIRLGEGGGDAAVEAVLHCLEALADAGPAARARDMAAGAFSEISGRLRPASTIAMSGPSTPVGEFELRDGVLARGFALPFGQIAAEDLAAFANGLDPETELRLAPGRGLLVFGLSSEERGPLMELAKACGLATDPHDPCLRVVTCAGAPACASAHLPTKQIAAAVLAERNDLLQRASMLHISGCAKQCARPTGPSVALVGCESGCDVEFDGIAADAATRKTLMRLAERFDAKQRRSA